MEPPKGSVLLVDPFLSRSPAEDPRASTARGENARFGPNTSASTPLAQLVEQQGYLVHTADSADAALGAALRIAPDVLMAPIALDDLEPGLFQRLREQLPQTSIVALGEQEGQRDVERALRRGADRYLPRPANGRAVAVVLSRAMEKPELARKLAACETSPAPREDDPVLDGIVGAHPTMQLLFNRVIQAARSKATVLIHGETGTGKELIASAIHKNSRRRDAAFVRVNCAALAEGVLESELFGHEKGSFTGANGARKGRFEQADGGTLFLDEIS